MYSYTVLVLYILLVLYVYILYYVLYKLLLNILQVFMYCIDNIQRFITKSFQTQSIIILYKNNSNGLKTKYRENNIYRSINSTSTSNEESQRGKRGKWWRITIYIQYTLSYTIITIIITITYNYYYNLY